MGDKAEKSCPICTEEMDLTDQQLKPCKCGYEICVWCWHHIMEMAEKDTTEGRCPACRTAYDRDRIVAMAANCQRLVAEMNSQQKKKMQKLKPKASDGRKHLSDVRVIQRNLVYIIGLPLNLADEDLLQRREYFGRYGKVLKVSISRTATGVIQHSANSSCCVYITYSKEAEAVRCIQSVHCFVLEGRSLRACFGTTKYCHAWLRNVPCSNRDCLYLHDYGSQEDSFTKDELVLAFARSRVQQVIGATNNLHRRSGSVLPPPTDDLGHVSSVAKPVMRNPLDRIENQIKVSCSGGGPVSSMALPATTSWVMCVSGNLPPDTSSSHSVCSNDPHALVSGVASTERSTLNTRGLGKSENSSDLHSNGRLVPLEMSQCQAGLNSQTSFMDNDQDVVAPSAASTSFLELSKARCGSNVNKAVSCNSIGDVQGLCSGLSTISIGSQLEDTYSTPDSDSLLFTYNSTNSSRQHLQQDKDYSKQHSTSPVLWEDISVDNGLSIDSEQSNCSTGNNNLSSGLCSPSLPQNQDQSSHCFWQQDQIFRPIHPSKPCGFFNEPLETGFQSHVESKDSVTGIEERVASDMGESSIISNILSLELDAWDDSLTLPQSLVKLLGDSDEQSTSLKASTLRKVQDKHQSRFSFARQDEFSNEASDLQQSFGITGHASSKYSASGGLKETDTLIGKYNHFLPSSNCLESDVFVGSRSFSPTPFSAHASTPPGFSLSSRVPPGFSCGRAEVDCNSSGKHLPQQYLPPSGNIVSLGDVEFTDPAILEVGKGMLAGRQNSSFDLRQPFLPQFSPGEDDARLKLLMQPTQSMRFPTPVGYRFSPQNDAYKTSPRLPDQFRPNNSSIYEQLHTQQLSNNMLTSNSQWVGWNDAKNLSGLAMPEVLNNERLGFNNFISSYENVKF